MELKLFNIKEMGRRMETLRLTDKKRSECTPAALPCTISPHG